MKRFPAVFTALLLTLGFSACSEPEVAVQAALDPEGAAEPVALADLPIRLLPYDRDAIFDSLTAAADEPEPEIPPAILEQQAAVQTAQAEWQAAEARWSVLLDSVRQLSAELQQREQQGQRATPQYQQAFQRFEAVDAEFQQVEQQRDAAFAEFTELQEGVLAQADSIQAVRTTWANRAFEDFDLIAEARLEESGLEVHEDTTNAAGIATFQVPEGQWWVYARYALPYQELYWNEEIEVTGDSTMVMLNRENAEARPLL